MPTGQFDELEIQAWTVEWQQHMRRALTEADVASSAHDRVVLQWAVFRSEKDYKFGKVQRPHAGPFTS